MNLSRLRIQNFRSYKNSGWIEIDDKTILVGENNAGKSNLLRALNLLFDTSSKSRHNIEDSHQNNDENSRESIIIEAVFDVTEEENEALGEYVTDDEFRLRAKFPFGEDGSAQSKRLIVQQEVPKNEDLDPNRLEDTDADKVVEIYQEHRETLKEYQVDNWDGEYKKYIIPTVERYLEEGNPELVQQDRTDPKGLRKKLDEHLPEFQYFEANRDIESETRTTTTALLGQLLSIAIEETAEQEKQGVRDSLTEVREKLNEEQKFDEIEDLEERLRSKLNDQIPLNSLSINIQVPELQEILSNVKIEVDDGVTTGLMDMGAGLHTVFILSCLRELTEMDENSSNVVFALEEPENDLHPHAQRQLHDTINKLTDQNYQVIMSTHSAHLVSPEDIFHVRRVEKRKNASKVHMAGELDLGEKQIEKLKRQIDATNNELFFSKAVLLSEGPTEEWVLPLSNILYDNIKTDIYAFDRLGVSLLTTGGKSGMKPLLRITNAFNIPSVALIDDDSEKDEGHESLREELEQMATVLKQWPNDIETELFRSVSFNEFCDVMSTVAPDYEKSPSELKKGVDNGDEPPEVIMRHQFENHDFSKPLFGKLVSEKISSEDLPKEVVDLMKTCRQTATASKTEL